jgi:hypothetical protein
METVLLPIRLARNGAGLLLITAPPWIVRPRGPLLHPYLCIQNLYVSPSPIPPFLSTPEPDLAMTSRIPAAIPAQPPGFHNPVLTEEDTLWPTKFHHFPMTTLLSSLISMKPP